MTAWFLVYVLSYSLTTGKPETGMIIDQYPDQLHCEAKKFTAVKEDFYKDLVCVERDSHAV
jgi:hypothetical protein